MGANGTGAANAERAVSRGPECGTAGGHDVWVSQLKMPVGEYYPKPLMNCKGQPGGALNRQRAVDHPHAVPSDPGHCELAALDTERQ